MPLFSVIIPTYNRAALLREALASVFAQTFTDYEIIVVDDGSTDETRGELQALSSRVRAYHQKNAGPGLARNLGAKHAAGEYLAFLDSDDLWYPWTLETYATGIGKFPQSEILGGTGTFFNSGGPESIPELAPDCTLKQCLYEAMRDESFSLPTPAVAFRRSSFISLGGFSEAYVGEDMDLWLRAGCLPGFVKIESPPLCAERQHVSRTTQNLDKTLAGLEYALAAEAAGHYPGGKEFAFVRNARIARATRSVSMACLRTGAISHGWRLYRASTAMNWSLSRWRYLIGFPIATAIHIARRRISGPSAERASQAK
jgi:GT2 family glycosyltransferase